MLTKPQSTKLLVADIPVVQDYPNVFPDKLPGFPLEREIDFVIEVHPGVDPILIPPY